MDSALRAAVQQDYNIFVSGGNEASNYSLSLGYTAQETPVAGKMKNFQDFRNISDHKRFIDY